MNTETATVFVVDDDAGVRKSLGRLLEAVGLSAETFASGPEFLDAIQPDRAGCLVLDLRLREGSGLEVQDELRRRGNMMPIIIALAIVFLNTVRVCVFNAIFNFLLSFPL